MAAIDTRPLPIGAPLTAPHEHAWRTESRHRTSQGVVCYVRCAECLVYRVDIQVHSDTPPRPVSRALGAT